MENENSIFTTVHHLFRDESGRMVSVLVKIFGGENYELAEDVVQDTLLAALETWKIKGIPDHPKAWLYSVAKNKAIDQIRKRKHSQVIDFNNSERKLLSSEYTLSTTMDQMWSETSIQDDFLGMMYASCVPQISEEARITIILKALCGFSTKEIAKTFLTSEDTVSKRLYRTKEYFRKSKLRPSIPPDEELPQRTYSVLNAIYLIFNEGYNSTHNDDLIRKDLLEQAFALNSALLKNEKTKQPQVYALMALMCYHASRNPGRISKEGKIIPLALQDRSLWDREMIELGNHYMSRSAYGDYLSPFHLEAAISYEHCIATTYQSTNWKRIIGYYDRLLHQKFDKVVFLNRTIASMELDGPEGALDALTSIDQAELSSYYLYHATLGEIHQRLGNISSAMACFEEAKHLTQSKKEKQFLSDRIATILN